VTLTVRPVEELLDLGATTNGPANGATNDATTGTAAAPGDATSDEARTAALLERVAQRSDGTLALPQIGPVLEEDGSTPSLRPADGRVLTDGRPVVASVVVLEDQRVRIETDGPAGFALELQAMADGTPLPIGVDGTLLLDRDGSVEVIGSGFLAGSTVEVWMFSTATFLGTAVVGDDGSFTGSFLIDTSVASGEHTIQLNGVGADRRVRSTSLGVRIDDPENPTRERIALVGGGLPGPLGGTSPVWLALLAAGLGAVVTGWGFVRVRRRGAAF
jgi:hypothetical protein